MDPVIHTEGLTMRYRSSRALSMLDLDVPAGVLFGYLGPNGAGKTTTIRLLAGLIRPTGGRAFVLGTNVARDREAVQLLREARAAGRTIFLSSHVLSEVEAVADMVGILRQGRLVEVASVSDLKARALRRVDLTFRDEVPVDLFRDVSAVAEVRSNGSGVQLVVRGSMAQLLGVAAPYGIANVVSHEPDLEEIFLTYYGQA